MTDEKNHARPRPPRPRPEPKEPDTLPGPNRQHDTARYGEALAPGTIPDEERKERERQDQTQDGTKPAGGVDRP